MWSTRLQLLCLSFLCNLAFLRAEQPPFLKTPDGVIVYTDPEITGHSQAVKLEVVTDNIIRVIASPGKKNIPVESLVRIYPSDVRPDGRQTGSKWEILEGKDELTLKTSALSAIVQLKTGSVSFFDASGKLILSETKPGGRSFLSSHYEGKPGYQLAQSFQSTADDAWYGLGQHQDGLFNYRGQQVNFFQNNTEVAVPFLISPKNYGILWDNYSITRVGDTRPFLPLSAYQLFSKNGQPGWLTASYFNDRRNLSAPVLERAETAINMEFLGESKIVLPAEFLPANGMVVWEGSIGSESSGSHKMRLTYGGSIRVWVDGKLVLDRWRKAWNPTTQQITIPIQKGVKTPIKIEWIPEGAESYLALKMQPPQPEEEQNRFAFWSEAGQQVDYYFIYGNNMDSVIAGYRKLTGKAPIVPKWALGFWQSRERYKTQQELLDVVKEYRKRKIPLDNIVLDWSYWKEDEWGSQDFEASRFPAPDSLINVLHKQYNTRFMISVWPKFYEGINAYNDFDEKGWLYKRNIADRQRDWIGKGYVSTFYDAFNEDARKGFWQLINEKIYSKGIDAWWMDASEPDILSNVSPEKRKQQMSPTALGPATEFLNAYPLQNAKGIYEGQRSVDSNKRVFLLTRSGFAGSQRYGATIWSGDIGATWNDMKMQIPAGINFSLSGIPYWTMDIGGFVVENRFEKPDAESLEEWRELNNRWYQFGAFVPLFRSHGQFPYREIYNIAPESHPAYQSMVYYNKLRYRLMPYIYSIAGKTYHDDYTIMRGLAMDFGHDKKVWNIGDQYMFGPSLLINPVYEYKQRNRDLYLPGGQGWYDFFSGKWYAGEQHINADAPYDRMPIFIKEGSIIPVGTALQYTDEKPADTISLYVYQGRDASFEIYEDDGLNYDYEKGKYSTIPLRYEEKTGTLHIGERAGSYPGMLTTRIFRITSVSKKTPSAFNPDTNKYRKLVYQGKPLKIKL